MGKIYYLLGKSASGKDTLYKKLMADPSLGLQGVVMYTTRPRRAGETDGKDYHFIDGDQLEKLRRNGLVIEERTYQTVHGPWTYLTVRDEALDLAKGNYLIEGVLQSYVSTRDYFGADRVVPLYVEVEDGERLLRAIRREQQQPKPRYAELCRRFLTDSQDFSEDKLAAAGITRRFVNDDPERCAAKLAACIRGTEG